MNDYDGPSNKGHLDTSTKRRGTLTSIQRRFSVATTNTVIDGNGANPTSRRKRLLGHVPSLSKLIRSDSVGSFKSTQTSGEPEKSRLSFAARRQSLTRATTAGLNKMVPFSISNTSLATAGTPPASSATTPKLSKFNPFVRNKSKDLSPGARVMPPSPPGTPRRASVVTYNNIDAAAATVSIQQPVKTNNDAPQQGRKYKHRASWSPLGMLRPTFGSGDSGGDNPRSNSSGQIGSPTTPGSSAASSSSSLKRVFLRDSDATLSTDASQTLDQHTSLHPLALDPRAVSAAGNQAGDEAVPSLSVSEPTHQETTHDAHTPLATSDSVRELAKPDSGETQLGCSLQSDTQWDGPKHNVLIDDELAAMMTMTTPTSSPITTMPTTAAVTATCLTDKCESIGVYTPSPPLNAPALISSQQMQHRSDATHLSPIRHRAVNKRHSIASFDTYLDMRGVAQDLEARAQFKLRSSCLACTKYAKGRHSAQRSGYAAAGEGSILHTHSCHTTTITTTASSSASLQRRSWSSILSTHPPCSPFHWDIAVMGQVCADNTAGQYANSGFKDNMSHSISKADSASHVNTMCEAEDADHATLQQPPTTEIQQENNKQPDASVDRGAWSCLALLRPILSQQHTARAVLVPATDEEQQSLIEMIIQCIIQAQILQNLVRHLSQSDNQVSALIRDHEAHVHALHVCGKTPQQYLDTFRLLAAKQMDVIDKLNAIARRLNPDGSAAVHQTVPQSTANLAQPYIPWQWFLASQPVRWYLSSLLGTTVGTGSVVYSHKAPSGQTTDLVVAGSCSTTELPLIPQHLVLSAPEHTVPQTPVYHHYLLHIQYSDRSSTFACMPRRDWVPDAQVTHCQWSLSPTANHSVQSSGQQACLLEFNWYHRKHHCRSCGRVVCQKHSTNRLPLFDAVQPEQGEWARVCDTCFYRLLTHVLP